MSLTCAVHKCRSWRFNAREHMKSVLSSTHDLMRVPSHVGPIREQRSVEILIRSHKYLSSARTTALKHQERTWELYPRDNNYILRAGLSCRNTILPPCEGRNWPIDRLKHLSIDNCKGRRFWDRVHSINTDLDPGNLRSGRYERSSESLTYSWSKRVCLELCAKWCDRTVFYERIMERSVRSRLEL